MWNDLAEAHTTRYAQRVAALQELFAVPITDRGGFVLDCFHFSARVRIVQQEFHLGPSLEERVSLQRILRRLHFRRQRRE
jgi:hypothetical protein